MSPRLGPLPSWGRRGNEVAHQRAAHKGAAHKGAARQVFTQCPRSGQPQATHARLTARQFSSLSGPLLYWCSRCRAPHEAARDSLWLDPGSGVISQAAAPATSQRTPRSPVEIVPLYEEARESAPYRSRHLTEEGDVFSPRRKQG